MNEIVMIKLNGVFIPEDESSDGYEINWLYIEMMTKRGIIKPECNIYNMICSGVIA